MDATVTSSGLSPAEREALHARVLTLRHEVNSLRRDLMFCTAVSVDRAVVYAQLGIVRDCLLAIDRVAAPDDRY